MAIPISNWREYCDKSIVRDREYYFIKLFHPEYNILNNAGLGYNHTEALFARKERKAKAQVFPGKISEKLQAFPKLRAHVTSLILANSDKVEITNIDTKEVIYYDSVRKAAEPLNCSPNTIRKHSAGKKRLKFIYQITIFPHEDRQK
jgi:hypothetical protein